MKDVFPCIDEEDNRIDVTVDTVAMKRYLLKEIFSNHMTDKYIEGKEINLIFEDK